MSVTVRGRVPGQWNDQTVAHITERFRALETAVAGGVPKFTAPSVPAFGPGAGGGGGGGGGTPAPAPGTTTTITQGSWSRTFLLMGA